MANLNTNSTGKKSLQYPQNSQYVDPNLTPMSAPQIHQSQNFQLPQNFQQNFQYQSHPYIHQQVQPVQAVQAVQAVQNIQNVHNFQPLDQSQQLYYPQNTAPIPNPDQLQLQQTYQNPFFITTALPVQSNNNNNPTSIDNNMYIPHQDLMQSYYNQPLNTAPLLPSSVPVYNFPNSQIPLYTSTSTTSSYPQTPVISTSSGVPSSIQLGIQPSIQVHSDPSSPGVSPLGSSAPKSTTKSRRKSKSATPQPRKRTTRACDQCNHLRTKCDGKQPCGHCISANLDCQYLRVPLKRGKASITYLESVKEKKAQEAERLRLKAEKAGLKAGTSGSDEITSLGHSRKKSEQHGHDQHIDPNSNPYFGQFQ